MWECEIMRTLERNKRPLYYALYMGEVENRDANGHLTSERTPTYGTITKLDCNVSASAGSDIVEAFGGFTNYTRTITVADINCPINENSRVWFGIPTSDDHNYIVTKKADSKNGILYALLKV